MLYEVSTQPKVFAILAIVGFLCGFLFDVKDVLFFKSNKIISQIALFFVTFAILFVFFILNLTLNFGQFRLFAVVAFFLSFFIQRAIIKNFVANKILKCYNKHKKNENERKMEKP